VLPFVLFLCQIEYFQTGGGRHRILLDFQQKVRSFCDLGANIAKNGHSPFYSASQGRLKQTMSVRVCVLNVLKKNQIFSASKFGIYIENFVNLYSEYACSFGCKTDNIRWFCIENITQPDE
jgi:hypothetical protein